MSTLFFLALIYIVLRDIRQNTSEPREKSPKKSAREPSDFWSPETMAYLKKQREYYPVQKFKMPPGVKW